MGKFCGDCGNAVPEDSKFCGECGSALVRNRKSVVKPICAAEPNSDRRLRSWYARLSQGQLILLWGIALILVPFYGVGLIGVIFLGFLAIGQPGSSPFFSGRVVLGANVRNLTAEESRRAGSNHGVVVMSVVTGSPAFIADVLPGDTLKAIGGVQVYDTSCYNQLLGQFEGKRVALGLLRDGNPLSIIAQLNG